MQSNPSNFNLYDLNHGKSLASNQSYNEVLTLVKHLQQIACSQQAIIEDLAAKQKETDAKLHHYIERQESLFFHVKQEHNMINSTDAYEQFGDCKQEYESDNDRPQIIRRNGFKSPSSGSDKSDSDNSKKSKRIPSKAKHLWINYGKRIIQYATENTEGKMQQKVRQLFGRLNTKKDYREVFGLTIKDNEEQKKFKIELGMIAIEFLKTKSSGTFERATHREEMISQWTSVAEYIEKLISE